jgi:hypothetical protein
MGSSFAVSGGIQLNDSSTATQACSRQEGLSALANRPTLGHGSCSYWPSEQLSDPDQHPGGHNADLVVSSLSTTLAVV